MAINIRYIISLHQRTDFDLLVSARLLEDVLISKYNADVEFVFIDDDTTYNGIKVNPKNACEEIRRSGETLRIYHVDCGHGLFDHHNPNSTASSSAQIIADFYNVEKTHPEWLRIVRWANQDDQGELEGYANISQILRGWNNSGTMTDQEIFNLGCKMLDGLLTQELIRLDIAEYPIEEVTDLVATAQQLWLRDEDIILVKSKKQKYGRVGIAIVNDFCEMGNASGRLLKDCSVVIGRIRNARHTVIYTQKDNGTKGVDLRGVAILSGIRAAEGIAREITLTPDELLSGSDVDGMAWHPLVNLGSNKVVSLINGSPKVPIHEDMLTKLTLAKIAYIVMQRLTKFM